MSVWLIECKSAELLLLLFAHTSGTDLQDLDRRGGKTGEKTSKTNSLSWPSLSDFGKALHTLHNEPIQRPLYLHTSFSDLGHISESGKH